jgi:hypothetical protein
LLQRMVYPSNAVLASASQKTQSHAAIWGLWFGYLRSQIFLTDIAPEDPLF